MSLLTITKLSDSVGAEVTGLDPAHLAADDPVGETILDALEDNGVLVFRGLHLDPESQVAFCRRLGAIDHSSDGHHPVAGIYPVTLDKSKNSSAAYLKATFDWHIDGCTPTGDDYPQKATVLSAKQVAERGGETEFASSYAAYDALTDDERDRYGALRVVHSLEASQRRITPDPTPKQLAQWRSRRNHEHPLVWTHRSGRKSLVLGASADYVVGMGREEGSALLAELLDRATVPALVYSHNWSIGDTVIWDNRGVLHRAAPYDSSSEREMLRTTVLGDEPIQ
ncbi:TauD/TfdA dioxygenase family protein [Mycobacterium montefiorense]|uniref:Dioxygenase TauD/TfdA family protein n=1 Tax=Mycobacterium montefiorense TaxID=154654 RepID=A0AA37PMX8_9MYCO|nr:TauD/TfdA family dioxygenase [Mycobacterium montefiorense]GBG35865.1 dioxygenase TauD/TfdA family protein [Mycobacterium montefiorense]GKU35369.1 dioxygenase TauD/TfdA family protein [Mycobacterium montefiorense]GKU40370.1 dioxygenase TauD/TfdA family protein [Mycobacterium montefiorense]GKU45748.1 dioxygenase TauD/TfdA family protein [Mycobacterium montefiorense]GKU50104.1 dioxygenase TauD/TfdA family protein [Mycobacterium montefiorense]